MNLDSEIELWRTEWQSASEAPALAELRRRVARESLYMRILLVTEILVTIVIGGGSIVIAARDPRPANILLASATWLFITVAWIFALVSRRNSWTPVASTTAAFLELSIRRCHAALRSVIFGAILYAVEMTFCLTWIFHETHALNWTTLLIVTLITAIFAIFLMRYRRKKRTELSYLKNLQPD